MVLYYWASSIGLFIVIESIVAAQNENPMPFIFKLLNQKNIPHRTLSDDDTGPADRTYSMG